MNKKFFITILVIVTIISSCSFVSVPFSPGIKKGNLANGVNYFIINHKNTPKRVQMRLVVKGGATIEDEESLGYTHLIEHLAFEGTKNYSGTSILDWLDSIGMNRGEESNAYTSYRNTSYRLHLPTDDGVSVDMGLDILHDWAKNISFSEESIKKEKAIVLEELRTQYNASNRVDALQNSYFYGSDGVSDILGTEASITNATKEKLESYYKKWYAAGLLSIIVVGDIDPKLLEAKIKDKFKDIHSQTPIEFNRLFYQKWEGSGDFNYITDPELNYVTIKISFYTNLNLTNKLNGSLERNRYTFLRNIIDDRLYRYSNVPDSKLTSLETYHNDHGPCLSSYTIEAKCKKPDWPLVYWLLMSEIHALNAKGFTDNEIARQKQISLDDLEYNKDGFYDFTATNLSDILEECTTLDKVFTDYKYKSFLYKQTIDTYNKNNVKNSIKDFLQLKKAIIQISAPVEDEVSDENSSNVILTGMEYESERSYVSLAPDVKNITIPNLIPEESLVEWKKVIEDEALAETATFDNGIKVVLVKTNNPSNYISMEAVSIGGYERYSNPQEKYIARHAGNLLFYTRPIGADFLELSTYLSSTKKTIVPWVGDLREGISGTFLKKDSEQYLSVLTELLKENTNDNDQISEYLSHVAINKIETTKDVESSFYNKFNSLAYQYELVDDDLSQEEIEKLSPLLVRKICNERFIKNRDFIFVFRGNFDLDLMKASVDASLGNLSAHLEPEEKKVRSNIRLDKNLRIEASSSDYMKVSEQTLLNLEVQKAIISICYGNVFPLDQSTSLSIKMLRSILQSEIQNYIREELHSTYNIDLSINIYEEFVNPEYRLFIDFYCDPKKSYTLLKSVEEYIEKFQTSKISLQSFHETQKSFLKYYEENKYNDQLLAWNWAESFLISEYTKVPLQLNKIALLKEIDIVDLENLLKTLNFGTPIVEAIFTYQY